MSGLRLRLLPPQRPNRVPRLLPLGLQHTIDMNVPYRPGNLWNATTLNGLRHKELLEFAKVS